VAQYENFEQFYAREFGIRSAELGERVTATLKDLLEKKHLYQSAEVDFGTLLSDFTGLDDSIREMLAAEITGAVLGEWGAADKADHRPDMAVFRGIRFETPDVKLYCSSCDRIEAFNSLSTIEISTRGIYEARCDGSDRTAQAFALSLECQSCKGPPEVFLIQRRGSKLTLSGRAPIEHVAVPTVIPATVRKWYSGAVVAQQSGQTLAGLFLLRTLIEQWVREASGKSDLPAVDLLKEYKRTLPDDFKQRFPSLGDVYSRLSDDIHCARGSEAIFEESRQEITRHFDARRIFDL